MKELRSAFRELRRSQALKGIKKFVLHSILSAPLLLFHYILKHKDFDEHRNDQGGAKYASWHFRGIWPVNARVWSLTSAELQELTKLNLRPSTSSGAP